MWRAGNSDKQMELLMAALPHRTVSLSEDYDHFTRGRLMADYDGYNLYI
jgi:hypothetical protein